ncbi:564_t:CDS:2, partial [Scutellospora calospora]
AFVAMSKTQKPASTGSNRFSANSTASINVPSSRSVSFSPEQVYRNYGSLASFSQSFGQGEYSHNEGELSQSHSYNRTDGDVGLDHTIDNQNPPSGSLYSRRGTKIPFRIPLSPNTRKISRSRGYYTVTPGSYSASFSNERTPWNTLRYYNDTFFIGSPTDDNLYDDSTSLASPNYDDVSCVIMDDGTIQKRRVSLNSEYSRQNTFAGEQAPLLDYYDSDSDSEYVKFKKPPSQSFCHRAKTWLRENTLTQNNKNIIKCALAYFLASLFTYIPFLNESCGFDKSYNSHLVATVSVFFDPAKSFGGIYEAVFYAIIGGLYGMSVSIGSMLSAVWFNEHNMNLLGHIISVVFWCGGSMFIVAFSKAKINKPSFNSVDDINYTDKSVQSAIESYRATFTSLNESLKQATLEIHNRNMQEKLHLYKKVVESLTRLAQHLGGLRSCCGLQWEIIKDSKDKEKPLNNKSGRNEYENEDTCDLKALLELIHYIGPHMKSLAYTCKQTLSHLQEQFVETDNLHSKIVPSFTLLSQNQVLLYVPGYYSNQNSKTSRSLNKYSACT